MFFSKQVDMKRLNAEIDQYFNTILLCIKLYVELINSTLNTFDL